MLDSDWLELITGDRSGYKVYIDVLVLLRYRFYGKWYDDRHEQIQKIYRRYGEVFSEKI